MATSNDQNPKMQGRIHASLKKKTEKKFRHVDGISENVRLASRKASPAFQIPYCFNVVNQKKMRIFTGPAALQQSAVPRMELDR